MHFRLYGLSEKQFESFIGCSVEADLESSYLRLQFQLVWFVFNQLSLLVNWRDGGQFLLMVMPRHIGTQTIESILYAAVEVKLIWLIQLDQLRCRTHDGVNFKVHGLFSPETQLTTVTGDYHVNLSSEVWVIDFEHSEL